jgi:hypothetical protein
MEFGWDKDGPFNGHIPLPFWFGYPFLIWTEFDFVLFFRFSLFTSSLTVLHQLEIHNLSVILLFFPFIFSINIIAIPSYPLNNVFVVFNLISSFAHA